MKIFKFHISRKTLQTHTKHPTDSFFDLPHLNSSQKSKHTSRFSIFRILILFWANFDVKIIYIGQGTDFWINICNWVLFRITRRTFLEIQIIQKLILTIFDFFKFSLRNLLRISTLKSVNSKISRYVSIFKRN